MIGRDDQYLEALERAHRAHLDAGHALRAVRCAFWISVNLVRRGEMGRGGGWLARARRLLDGQEAHCAEHGYLLIPTVFEQAAGGEPEAAAATAAAAAEVGERLGDRDLFALAVHTQGHVLIRAGRIEKGLGLLDEAMVAVTAGELSPIATGLVYCGAIDACQEAYELGRAQEWTAALTQWCERQPDLVAFTGRCLVHRAEIMQLRGAWPEALEEARRAGERCARAMSRLAAGEASYRQGELHRLRGELGAAEEAYREASGWGCEPQPGLALLRQAEGDDEAAAAALRRAAAETAEPLRRARLLPAMVEILLATGEIGEARAASGELEQIAQVHRSRVLDAIVARARGAVHIAEGESGAALAELRRAWRTWQDLEAPYEAARVRVLVSVACGALGDQDSAALELEAARAAFEELGAVADLGLVDSLTDDAAAGAGDAQGLTARELEVLRFVAAGETNRAIAAQLVLSERTVDRHVSNILAKLGVRTRAAATAYAYEHQLL